MDVGTLKQLWDALEASEEQNLKALLATVDRVADAGEMMQAQMALGRWLFNLWQDQRPKAAKQWTPKNNN